MKNKMSLSEFQIDYARVQKVLKEFNPLLADEDKLVRKLTYLLDEARREGKLEGK